MGSAEKRQSGRVGAGVGKTRAVTAFEQKVYALTSTIPCGMVSTYGEVAKVSGHCTLIGII